MRDGERKEVRESGREGEYGKVMVMAVSIKFPILLPIPFLPPSLPSSLPHSLTPSLSVPTKPTYM